MPLPIQPRPVVTTPPSTPVATPAATIREAEKLLKLAGFSPGTVDGKESPAFKKSVEGFQGAWGLPVTGAVDARTLEKMRSTGKRIRARQNDFFASIGQKSGAIKTVEQRLQKLGYDVGKADGVFSRQTADAVKKFKADQPDIKHATGSIGSRGAAILKKEVQALSHRPERRRLAPTKSQTRLDTATAKAASKRNPDGSVGLAEGARGNAVKNVQRHLRAAGFNPTHTNGVFDERTGGALKAFQKHSGLSPTGQVDTRTWAALKKSFILSKKPASPAQALGERSGAVKASEQLLKKLGFNPGKVDGLFDSRTQRAVKAFEKRHHLTRDGQIGANQLEKMKKLEAGAGYRNKVLDTARRWLGFREGAGNKNPFSKYFGRGPEAWCADFVSYCYTKAGKKLNDPWTPSLLQTLKNNGTWNRNNPKPGDIIMFDWNPGSGRLAEHTGLVEKVYRSGGKTWVQTIEGNSGDMVRRNRYAVGDPRISFGTIR